LTAGKTAGRTFYEEKKFFSCDSGRSIDGGRTDSGWV